MFSKNSFRSELHTPFLKPYFDTQHLICKYFHFDYSKKIILYLGVEKVLYPLVQ